MSQSIWSWQILLKHWLCLCSFWNLQLNFIIFLPICLLNRWQVKMAWFNLKVLTPHVLWFLNKASQWSREITSIHLCTHGKWHECDSNFRKFLNTARARSDFPSNSERVDRALTMNNQGIQDCGWRKENLVHCGGCCKAPVHHFTKNNSNFILYVFYLAWKKVIDHKDFHKSAPLTEGRIVFLVKWNSISANVTVLAPLGLLKVWFVLPVWTGRFFGMK